MQGHNQPDDFTLSGDRLDRIRQVLRLAQHQVRVGQTALDGRRLEDALVDAEEAIGDLLARIDGAAEDDIAEAAEGGAGERQRQAWFPSYHAA